MSLFADRRGGVDGELTLADRELTRRTGSEQRYRLAYTKWSPQEVSAPTVVYNHGLQSHRGWFAATAAELAEETPGLRLRPDRFGRVQSWSLAAFRGAALGSRTHP